MERYLLNYLKNNINDPLIKKYIDLFKVEFDWYVYNYGDNVSSDTLTSFRGVRNKRLEPIIKRNIQYYSSLILKVKNSQNNILSGVSFNNQNQLSELGFNPISSILQPVRILNIIGDFETLKLLKKKDKIIQRGTFNDLLDIKLFKEFEDLKKVLIKSYLKFNFKGLILKTDQTFESKYLIEIFRILNKPSFILSHGLPGIYSKDVDNRSDYLLVWGNQIKTNYVNCGFDSSKIFVVGSNTILRKNKIPSIKNSTENILVVPCSSSLWHQHEWGRPKLVDRSMSILYLYQVQNTLMKLGIKHARFRPHPSIDKNWLFNFLDQQFYIIDNDSLTNSLAKSSLVIGSTSTVFLQALNSGVNYIIYEPNENGISLIGDKLVPPFDGSDPFVNIANNEEELLYMIKSHYLTNVKIIDKYLQPLDLEILKHIIKFSN